MYSLDNRKIALHFKYIRNFRIIWLTTLITVGLILGIYYLHPANVNWLENEDFSITNLLQFIFIDQYLIELVTTTVLTFSLGKYAELLKVNSLTLSWKGIFQFIAKFIPFILLVYFIIAPITISLRFFYHSIILGRTNSDYWESYFFMDFNLYIIYLFPLGITSLLLLGMVILLSVKRSKLPTEEMTFKDVPLTVKSASGEKIISSKHVEWIKKEGRKYVVKSNNTQYYTHKSLSVLEEELDMNFISINRSTLINLAFFEEYSFWENEKYILRMQDGENFNITRSRLKSLKSRLHSYRDLL